MRIKQISVSKLFGMFDHVIPLNLNEHMTIVHGPNGFGKTAMLRVLHSLFSSRIDVIKTYPFQQFQVIFEDNSLLKIAKVIDKEGKLGRIETFLFTYTNEEGENIYKPFHQKLSIRAEDVMRYIPPRVIEREIPEISRNGVNKWSDIETGELLDIQAVLDRWGYRIVRLLPSSTKSNMLDFEPPWFDELSNKVRVRFIDTNRLQNKPSSHRVSEYESRNREPVPMILTISKKIASAIQKELSNFARFSQALDRTFPQRLLESKKQSVQKLNNEELNARLEELEKKRLRFMNAGLLDMDETTDFQIPLKFDSTQRKILSLYVQDNEEKLKVLDKIAAQIEAFSNIINGLFTYKEISCNREIGISLKNRNGDPLELEMLSSGEQHEIVLMYELLFNIEPGSLVLIDEPEISLHIAWQQEFLANLGEIIQLSSFDILIATHSPAIASSRWDLTVDLEGNIEC
ncbi:AAA family ATPase [Sporomusa sphaeroides]|uniref:Endonuclease GajA/Old nuclease/RecF-like AAA domain-containing protein n=1 Tax=Sporomusa sphaeroides DSM 2875 TaxID=1337886 RepID=A0ABM9W870_9FIRM|nr:AAA family ATPase [Sporomusa sphaeroides]OLS57640.1 hypothetical protein SPSPH_11560 [Sporomusa sphaeroides DSM 2875]CVK21335.1 hypothetical protein SSPH_04022 [Sporomusa sphaeroides DSM 2875]